MSSASDFVIENGVLKKYVGPGGDVVIPEGVTSIGFCAFSGCSSLTSVTIPDGVTGIHACAFSSCSGLTSATIPNGVTRIGWSAFSGCSNLTRVTIPESVARIENGAFSGCSSLTSVTVPDGVTVIDKSAFSDCSSLTSITIPESVTRIEYGAFSGCSSLTSVTIPKSVLIGSWAFKGCSALADSEGFLIVNGILFNYMGSGNEVVIPEGVVCIDSNTFKDCSSLTSVTIPAGVTDIGYQAFFGCSNLTSLSVPGSVTFIGARAFFGCMKLTDKRGFIISQNTLYSYCGSGRNVVIPKNVTEIGSNAFTECQNLNSVTIPKTVTRIGYNAFGSCDKLKKLTIEGDFCDSDLLDPDAFRKRDSLEEITAPFVPFSYWDEKQLGMCAVKGFLARYEDYTNLKIFTEYIKFVSSKRKKLLPIILQKDAVQILRGMADAKKITKENIRQEFLIPAMQCKAEKCIEYLDKLARGWGLLEEDTVEQISPERELWDGIHFSFDGKKMLKYPKIPGQTEYTVPDGTIEICAGAFEFPPLRSVRIPDSVTDIHNGAFSTADGKELCVFLPANVKYVPLKAFFGMDIHVFTPNRNVADTLARQTLPIEMVYTGGPLDDLVTQSKQYAVAGFLYAEQHKLADMSSWRNGYLDHIKRNEKTYIKRALADDFLLHLMAENCLLSENGAKELLAKAKGRTEMTALLLEYQQKRFGDKQKKDEFSLSDNDPEIKRMQNMAARRESIKDQKGISGIAFVSTGAFEHFGKYNEYLGIYDMSDLKAYIEERGGFLRSAVSSKTDYLICNDPNSDSAKSKKAKELGVPVITEEHFLKMASEKE